MRFQALKELIHLVIAIFFWFVFAFYWRVVVLRPMGTGTKIALITVAVGTILTALYLIVWVRYNVVQASRLPPRTKRRDTGMPDQRDFLGRKFMVKNPARLRRARYVEIDVRNMISKKRTYGHKTYRIRRSAKTQHA